MLDLHPGDLIDGRYLVETLLGRGGMAEVYRVRHTQLDTQHALKVLSVGGRSLQARLMQEGRVQAALRHPNIVAVSDVVTVEGALGLVLEYVQGPPLDELIARRRLTEAQVDAIAVGVLDGVAAAHGLDLIHRDLKPANVMLDVGQRGLIPKVADFGLVKLVADEGDGFASATRSGTAMGTPAYMAPEQVRDAKGVDARADVWSLGAILYELAAGERCFDGPDVLELMVRVANGQRRPVTELVPNLPARWVDAIEGALVVDRDHRIPDVATLRARWLAGAAAPVDAWDPETLAFIRSLGSGGEAPEDFLRRSFRSQEQVRRTRPTAVPVETRPAAPTTYDLAADSEILGGAGEKAAATTAIVAPAFARRAPAPVTVFATPEVRSVAAPEATPSPDRVAPQPAPATAHPTARPGRSPLLLVALALIALGSVGAVSLLALGLGWSAQRQHTPTTAPHPAPATDPNRPSAAPAPTDPSVAPDPAPTNPSEAPAPRDPGAADPSATPAPTAPAPTDPSATPAPTEAAPTDPAGTDDAPTEPPPHAATAGVATAAVDAAGMTVSLIDARDRPADPSALPPGTYRVVAFFEPRKPTPIQEVTLAAGDHLAVRCVRSSFKCKVELTP